MKLVIESVYVLFCPQFPWRGKVGISANVEQRRASIEQEFRYRFGDHVRVWRLFRLPILTDARSFEQAIHNALKKLPYWECRTMHGTNGYTEWFWAANWILAILSYFACMALNLDCKALVAACVLILPLPLDFALFVLLLAAAEYAAAVGVGYLIFNFLT